MWALWITAPVPIPAEVLKLYQTPAGRGTLLATCCDQQGPAPAAQFAEALEQLFAKSGDLAHALDAADLYVLGAAPARAAKLLALIILRQPPPPRDKLGLLMVRLAGARIAVRWGPDFPAWLLDLATRIPAPVDEREATARMGAFAFINSLTDMPLIDTQRLRNILSNTEAAVGLVTELWGPAVVQGGLSGALLLALTRGEGDDNLADDVARKQTFLVQALKKPVPPRRGPAAAWARDVLAMAGLRGDANPFTIHYRVAAAPSLDHGLRELDAATARRPKDAHLWASRANTRFQRLLQPGVQLETRAELNEVLADVKRALALDPNNIAALMVKGGIEADFIKDPAAAITTYEAVLAVSPLDPLALLYRAVNRARRGDAGADSEAATAQFLLGRGP
jgi:tetratricopeptide (TPR) repeat protein